MCHQGHARRPVRALLDRRRPKRATKRISSAPYHHNQIFGDNILLQGILATEGNVRIVTSQPWIAENGALADITEADVVEYFESLGFQKSSVADVVAFYNKKLDLMVLDANLKNILRDFTGKLFPIDVVVGEPGSEIFERFGF